MENGERPLILLNKFSKHYPNAWQQVDIFREGKGVDLPNWPDWCFLPMSAFYSIISQQFNQNKLSLESVSDLPILSAVGIWRVTKGIYRFDPDVYEAIINTSLTGNLPSELFYQLPEWCIYIETPTLNLNQNIIHGVFVHVEYDINTGRNELRLLLDLDSNPHPIILHLGNWDIQEALKKFSEEAAKQAALANITFTEPSTLNLTISKLVPIIEPILSLILYLCSQNAEYNQGTPTIPIPKKTKKGWRIFTADKMTVWDIGLRIGAAIRAYQQSTDLLQSDSAHNSPRPHIRRAHWHSFWIGCKSNPSERKIQLKWLPPIPVNVEVGPIITTIRPVHEKN